MTQDERLEYLINALLEDPACAYAVDGRIAMPLFAFFIGEGCRYTKNRKKYFLSGNRMLIFAS